MSDKLALLAITQAKLFAYQLPFKASMQFQQYSLDYRNGLILQLTDVNGSKHFVEVAPLPGFSSETFADVKAEMMALLSTDFTRLLDHFSAYNSMQFALDSLLLITNNDIQPVSIDNIPLLQGNSVSITAQYQTLGKPKLIKLKVARESVDIDINNFQMLCQLNPQLKIRCDANQAWSKQQAEQFFTAINVEQLDYIEEPTCNHQNNLQLADKYSVNLALDETLQHPNFNYQHHQSIKAFVIKPMLIGNRHKIDTLVETANQFVIKVSISSSFESAVGLQSLKNLAATYVRQYHDQNLMISLGIDTLKYFSTSLLTQEKKIQQDCQQLELLWTSN